MQDFPDGMDGYFKADLALFTLGPKP